MSETAEITDIKGVAAAFGFQVVICAALITTFTFIRPLMPAVYQPRVKFAMEESKKPPALSIRKFAWAWPAFKTNEMDMIDKIGMDSIMFLRFILTCFKFFAGALVVAIPLTIFNFYAKDIDKPPRVILAKGQKLKEIVKSSLLDLTMENLQAESRYFYIYSICTVVLSFYAYLLFYWTWRDYLTLKEKYFTSQDYLDSPHSRTLLLNGISPKMQNNHEIQRLILNIDEMAEIVHIVYGRDFSEINTLCDQHRKTNGDMEQKLDNYFSGKKRPTQNSKGIVGLLTCSGEKVDSISTHSDKLNELEEKIYELRSRGDNAFDLRYNAFVSFSDLKSTQKILKNAYLPATFIKYGQLGTYLPGKLGTKLQVRECPPFDDLIWNNLGLSPKKELIQKLITWTLTALLTLGWTVVVGFISGLADLNTIAKVSPSIAATVARYPAAVIILESIIAPGLIAAAIPLLLIFIEYTSLFQGISSWNGVAKSVTRKFYYFQVYQFFLFICASSTWDYLDEEKRSDIGQSVVRGFLRNSTFYINFTILNFGGSILELLQAPRLIVTWIYFKFFRLVPRANQDLLKAPEFSPASITCSLLVIFLFCISYSIVAPLIVPFAAAFFGLTYIIFKYQRLYVYETYKESGGSWWPKIFNLLCFSLAFFQLMTAGSIVMISASKSTTGNGKVQSAIVFVQTLITLLYWFLINAKFRHNLASIQENLQPYTSPNLEYVISDPAMGDPLPKVWVKEEYQDKLPFEHQPKYSSVVDYMKANNINNPEVMETLIQRSAGFGRRHQVIVQSSGHEASPEVLMTLKPPSTTGSMKRKKRTNAD